MAITKKQVIEMHKETIDKVSMDNAVECSLKLMKTLNMDNIRAYYYIRTIASDYGIELETA